MVHKGAEEAGVTLTKVFNRHLQAMRKSEASNPEVQNRHRRQLGEARRTGRLGPTLSFSGDEANPLFHNDGTSFREIGTTLGISRREDGRGFVLVDLNRDGALDVVHHNHFRNPVVALINRAAGENHWVRFRLRGTNSNRYGIGARVNVGNRMQELQCGSGYLSAGAPELHFGLGSRETADVTVRWPSGKVDGYEALPADRIHTLHEGDPGKIRSEPLSPVDVEAPPAPAGAAPDLDVRSVLEGLKDLEGNPAELGDAPLVVIFFSETCYACRGELLRQGDLERQAGEIGARLVWITTDSDLERLKGQLLHIKATAKVYRPGGTLGPVPVPSVYLVTADRVEKFLGRHAVSAALEEVRRGRGRR